MPRVAFACGKQMGNRMRMKLQWPIAKALSETRGDLRSRSANTSAGADAWTSKGVATTHHMATAHQRGCLGVNPEHRDEQQGGTPKGKPLSHAEPKAATADCPPDNARIPWPRQSRSQWEEVLHCTACMQEAGSLGFLPHTVLAVQMQQETYPPLAVVAVGSAVLRRGHVNHGS